MNGIGILELSGLCMLRAGFNVVMGAERNPLIFMTYYFCAFGCRAVSQNSCGVQIKLSCLSAASGECNE
jgi:hypothetical protein